jgi:hypothetical protein
MARISWLIHFHCALEHNEMNVLCACMSEAQARRAAKAARRLAKQNERRERRRLRAQLKEQRKQSKALDEANAIERARRAAEREAVRRARESEVCFPEHEPMTSTYLRATLSSPN